MVVGSSLASRGSSDAADLDPRAIGLEMADVDHVSPTGDMSAAMAERPLKPAPPPKKAHLDEVIRLMKELEEMREEKAQAEEMTDMMGQDLQLAQEDVEKKDEELRRKEAELLRCGEELENWQQKAQNLANEVQEEKRLATEMKQSLGKQEVAVASWVEDGSGKGEELVRLRDQVASLIASLAAKDTEKQEAASQTEEELSYLRKQAEELTSSLAKKEAELTTKVSLAAGAAYDKWQPIIREKQLQFETTLRETEERLNAQVTQEQELRRTAEATLHATREEMRRTSNQGHSEDQQLRFQTTLREMEERLQAQLAQEQEQRRIAEETLRAAQEKIDTQSGQQEQELRTTKEAYAAHSREASARTAALQKRVQDAEASLQEHANHVQEAAIHQENLIHRIPALESEVQNQRKACEYFKKNSERLSREIKEADAARRLLEQSEYVAKRQAADWKAHVAALQQRPRGEAVSGAY